MISVERVDDILVLFSDAESGVATTCSCVLSAIQTIAGLNPHWGLTAETCQKLYDRLLAYEVTYLDGGKLLQKRVKKSVRPGYSIAAAVGEVESGGLDSVQREVDQAFSDVERALGLAR